MTAAPPPPTLPRIAGGFRLVRELGRGGMGIVYEAEELDSGRAVALKVLAAELSVEGEAFERFRREARLAAAISDVRCVFVYGAHEVEQSPAIAMELVGGETLQDKIARGDVIPVDTAVRWTIDVIDGLEAAHRSAVLHRDVKPSNCFVTPDGRVKVGDFGLSRSLERDIELTQSGQFLGSPLYASPEQIRGRAVDARSDQYSCAATLYALLTGRPPFEGANLGEVLARILSEPPARPRSIRPEIPRELEKVVLRAMDRDPDGRYRDLETFRDALLPFSSSEAATGSIPRRLGAYIVDSSLIGLVSSTLATAIQSNRDLVSTDTERPWTATPLWVQVALQAMPIAYFWLLEGWRGATLGKWLLGLRVATVGRGPALFVRALARAALFEGPALVFAILGLALARNQTELLLITFGGGFVLVLLYRVSTMRRRNGWRGPYEFLSGTRVVRAQLPFLRLQRSTPPPEQRTTSEPSLPERIGEYGVVGLVGHTASGALIHARDETLERSVWIQLRERRPPAGERRRSLARPARLRWLEAVRSGAATGDVFESPGGCDLGRLAHEAERPAWPFVERTLGALCDELGRCEEEDPSARFALGQVWLDRNWNVRLLDEPMSEGPAGLTAVELVGATAQALLRDGDVPQDAPIHAEQLVAQLVGQGRRHRDLGALRADLARCQARPPVVERRTRAAQLAVNTLLPALFTLFAGVMFLVISNVVPHFAEMKEMVLEVRTGRLAPPAENVETSVLSEASLRDRQLVLSYDLTHGFGAALAGSFRGEELQVLHAARTSFPQPSAEAVTAARERIVLERQQQRHDGRAALPASDVGPPSEEERRRRLNESLRARLKDVQDEPGTVAMAAATGGSLVWLAGACLSALILPGGITLRLFGIALRRRNGRRGGRLVGLVRAFALGAGPIVVYGLAFGLAIADRTAWSWLAFAGALALHAAGIVLTLASPARGPVDRVLGTRLVPR